MGSDPEQHHRRSIRLDTYDYTEPGAYFVTVCTQDHLCLFGDVIGSEMRMNEAGQAVQAVWDALPDHYPGVAGDASVVMPNHIHGIIMLAPVGAGPRACPGPRAHERRDSPEGSQRQGQPRGVAPTGRGRPTENARTLSLGDVVQRFKTLITKRYTDAVKSSHWPPFPGRLWQRNYYEHIIRSERALDHIRRYIVENPMRWAWDRENPTATTPEGPEAWRI